MDKFASKQVLSIRFFLSIIVILFWHAIAFAAPVDGNWVVDGATDFRSQKEIITPLAKKNIQILNNRVMLSSRCFFRISALNNKQWRRYKFSLGTVEYIKKEYKIDLSIKTQRYEIRHSECANNVMLLLANINTALFIAPGPVFYYFSRHPSLLEISNAASGEKISPFPFSLENYSMSCEDLIPRVKGIPLSTDKCGPLYFPYVARQESRSKIASLIGHHRYVSDDLSIANDYDDPLSKGLHPVYKVLRPLKDVQLVRVDDMDGNAEDRDFFSGAYLSIKSDMVVDQLNEGCDMTEDYVCQYDDRADSFRLLETGKFEKIR